MNDTIQITLSSGQVNVSLQKKRIKNIYLRVNRRGQITLTMPYRTTIEYAKEFIFKKRLWLNKQLEKQIVEERLPVNIIEREGIILYKGKPLTIKYIKDKVNNVVLLDEEININIKDNNDQMMKEKVLRNWWRNEAFKTFDFLVDRWLDILKYDKNLKPTIIIRKMKSLWGSCNKKNNKITFNEYLLKAPIESIEYVVLHELAHLKYFNHGKEFYNFISSFMPDYKQRKQNLSKDYPKNFLKI